MKSSSIVFVLLALTMVLAISLPKLHALEKEKNSNESEGLSSYIRGTTGRFLLADKPRAAMTCDKYPTVCGGNGSPGPYCCNKKCVNVLTDILNCGKCGRKCKYSEMCCQGKCVNPSVNKKHCGRCNHSCTKGSSCVYGLCSYA